MGEKKTPHSFDELMSQMLGCLDANSGKDTDKVIAEALKGMGASNQVLQDVTEISATIDKIQEKECSLAEAKANGESRKRWLGKEIYDMTQKVEDEELREEIVNAFGTVAQKKVDDIIKTDE